MVSQILLVGCAGAVGRLLSAKWLEVVGEIHSVGEPGKKSY